MEMENNPIDKLFAEKLRQVEKTPHADVWSQIQVRRQEKKRGAFWWTTIAASVLLLLISDGLSWQYFSSEQGDAAHHEIAVQSPEPKVVQPPATTYTAAQQPEKKAIMVEEKITGKPKIKFKARANQIPKPEPAPQPELIAVNPETSPTVTQPSISSEVAVDETKPTVLVMTFAEATVATEDPQPKSNATPKIKASAGEGAPLAVGGKKKTRAGKILQQFKHIKNGEKVEWKEIGIHPENLLAFVKQELTNKNNSSK